MTAGRCRKASAKGYSVSRSERPRRTRGNSGLPTAVVPRLPVFGPATLATSPGVTTNSKLAADLVAGSSGNASLLT